MGVSLLGMASNHKVGYTEATLQHNFIGVDLSRLGIRYANGICNKWNLRHCLKFVVDSAEQCLSKIRESYPGDVEVSCIVLVHLHLNVGLSFNFSILQRYS